ncbi:MAG: HNH endonuclease [Faecalibacterium sp.]|nr:HNH endonuclease [Ruminococcus sp.]MCM1392094.1 HNH endonuclease [Ruminococcus sp.]MCM1485791.1 HNH endonuclease [Faecalibacterium sp.]
MYKSCNKCGRIHKIGGECPSSKIYKPNTKQEYIFRSSQAWKNKREEIKERDKYLCVYCCASKDFNKDKFNYQDLSVHHIVPLCEDYEQRLDDFNLITLCRRHHDMAERGEIEKEVLRALVENIPPE